MSNMIEQAPQRIPEWLSLRDIARAWSAETGDDAAAFEDGFRDWFKDYLQRNAYGEDDASIPAQLLEGRQIWRETFETFCEETGLAKPRFWFPEGDQAPATPQPVAPEPAPIAEAVVEVPMPPNQDDPAPSRRRVREGGASFTWIAAGLVVAVVAGLVTIWLRDSDAPMADSGFISEAIEKIQSSMASPTQPASAQPAPAQPALAQPAPVQPASAQPAPVQPASAPPASAQPASAQPASAQPVPSPAAAPATGVRAPAVAAGPTATPAPTTVSNPAAAQIAAAPSMAKQTAASAASYPAVPATGRMVVGDPADQGLILLLQRELLAAGYDPGPLDGVSGTRFAAAITGYQRANNLHADGRATIELLSSLARKNLKAGRVGPPVPMAAPMAATTVAPMTARTAGLAAKQTPETGQGAGRGWTASLDSGTPPQSRPVARIPAPRGREMVRAIQKRLSDRGYYDGPLDGNLGPKTRHAIETYQRVQRYDATGQPSRAIYEELEDYALEVMGMDQFRKGAYDAAVVTYSRIIQRKPEKADAYFNRGLAYKNSGQVARALSDYEAAIALDPVHRRAYFDSANILYEQGLYRDALRAYFKALKLLVSIG